MDHCWERVSRPVTLNIKHSFKTLSTCEIITWETTAPLWSYSQHRTIVDFIKCWESPCRRLYVFDFSTFKCTSHWALLNVLLITIEQFFLYLIRKLRQCRVLHNMKHVGVFPGGSDGKTSARNAGGPGLIPGSGRSPGEGNGNPPQHSCLENSMDGGAWWATVHGVAKSQKRLSDFTKHVRARSTSSNVSWISDMIKFCP